MLGLREYLKDPIISEKSFQDTGLRRGRNKNQGVRIPKE